MAGRNRGGPPFVMKGAPHAGPPPGHEPPYGRNLGPVPHPALLDEMRESQFRMDRSCFVISIRYIVMMQC